MAGAHPAKALPLRACAFCSTPLSGQQRKFCCPEHLLLQRKALRARAAEHRKQLQRCIVEGCEKTFQPGARGVLALLCEDCRRERDRKTMGRVRAQKRKIHLPPFARRGMPAQPRAAPVGPVEMETARAAARRLGFDEHTLERALAREGHFRMPFPRRAGPPIRRIPLDALREITEALLSGKYLSPRPSRCMAEGCTNLPHRRGFCRRHA